MSIEKYIRHPAGQRDPLVQYRLRIRTKVLAADGTEKPYVVDDLYPTRAAALEAQEREWAYIRGERIKTDIVAQIASSTEPNVAFLLHRYGKAYTEKKAESGQDTEEGRLERTIPNTWLDFGSSSPNPALFREMKTVEVLGRHYVSFGSLRISACDKSMLKSYIRTREKKVKAETIRRELVLISCAFDRAFDLFGRKVENPVALLKDDEKPAPGEHRERVLTPDEEAKLLAQADKAKNPETGLAFRLALGTAMRRGDIYGLLWEAVDWEARTVNLGFAHKSARAAKTKGKRGKSRRVLLLPTAFEALRSHWERMEKPSSGRVFSLSPDGFKTALRRVLEKAELEDFHFHDQRHTVLTRLAAAGWSPIQVAKTQDITDAAHLERRAYEDEKAAKAMRAAESGKPLETRDLMAVGGHATPNMVGVYANLKPEDAPQNMTSKTKIRMRKEGARFVASCETPDGDLEAEGDSAAEARAILLSMI